MEVFRIDGAGKSYYNERLFRLLKLLEENGIKNVSEYIEKIIDNKGTLNVHFKEEHLVLQSLFICFWLKEKETSLNFYINNILIKEVSL